MLFFCNLTKDQLVQLQQSRLQVAIAELLRAHKLGNHFVVLARSTATALMDILELSSIEISTLRGISESYTQNGSLISRAEIFVHLTNNLTPIRTGKIISFPLTEIDDRIVGEATTLVSENQHNDGAVYRQILAHAAKRAGISRTCINLVHGGGTEAHALFLEKSVDGKLVVYISETDRKTPFETVAQSKSAALLKAEHSFLGKIFVLPCHEIENVLTHEVIRTLPCAAEVVWNQLLDKIELWEIAGNKHYGDRMCIYFDFKKGLSFQVVNGVSPKGQVWLQQRLLAAGVAGDGWKYTGFGENIIRQFRASNAAIALFDQKMRTPEWESIFGAIFREVSWWFIGAHPMRT